MGTSLLSLAARFLVITAVLEAACATPESIPGNDRGLAELIVMSLGADEHLQADGIKVTVDEGVAILTGNVISLAQSERAAERCKSAEGVRAVINQIGIVAPRLTRARLAESIRLHLSESPAIDAGRVKVAVNDRKAVLTGEVGTWDEQELAREIASEIPGVTGIENRIEVSFDTVRTDSAIGAQIAYLVADDPINDGLDIHIEVKEGVVRLAGEVGSQGEKDMLIHRSHVTGVTEVWADDVMVVRSLSLDGMTGKVASTPLTSGLLRLAFGKDERLRGTEITSSFHDNVLTLDGSAPSEEAKAAPESTARGLPGVEVVVNRIGEKHISVRHDSTIASGR